MVVMFTNHANGECKFDQKLRVSVAGPTHLKVTWKDAFKDCKGDQIVATNVFVDNQGYAQVHGVTEADVRANPCTKHELKVTLHMRSQNSNPDIVWSRVSHYNADLTIEEIYSGLLQDKFRKQVCAKSNSVGSTIPDFPEIPNGIKDCVFRDSIRRDGPHGYIIPIVNPRGGPGRSEITVECEPTSNKTDLKQNSEKRRTENYMFVITISGSCIVALIVTSVAFYFCVKTFQNHKKKKAQVDLNPVYNGGAEYEYDNMGIYGYGTAEVATRREKEEVVESTR